MNKQARRVVGLAIAGIATLIILLLVTASFVEKWLWMRELGYAGIFWRIFWVSGTLFGVAFAIALVSIWLSLRLALRVSAGLPTVAWPGRNTRGLSSLMAGLVALVPALIFAVSYYSQWDTYLRFRWGAVFGEVDPIFHQDIGFYLFQLPFYNLLQDGSTVLLFLLVAITMVAYVSVRMAKTGNGWQASFAALRWPAVVHLTVLFVLFVVSLAWGFYLDRYELLTTTRGVVHGIGYTDDHVTLMALWIMLFACLALAVLLVTGLLARRLKLVLGGTVAFFVLYALLIPVLPALFQKYAVEPSELELETPYLKSNIALTRKAYDLDKIGEKAYPALMDLTPADIRKNQETIDNVRLWDHRPILETYRQTQEFRLYYQFYDVDVGRYHTADGYHQVMLSGRELAPALPEKARTWVNERLQFTHGFGLVMNAVSKKSAEGLPQYLIENIPPASLDALAVTQPAIYYGERMPGYRIVGTDVKELDYPKGNENVYTSYAGHGGVPVSGWWRRILFAWTRSDINILLTGYLGPESRIQFWRRVRERVNTVAPFLRLDEDPYLVLSEGKLFWVQDAYTVSDDFPYSESYGSPLHQINYIRNSAKVVIDAYEGSVRLYVSDPDDPVLGVYREAFPGAFRPLTELSADLRGHLRYPEDLFDVQATMYRTYHMVDPQVFYNQEDLWDFPQEKYAGTPLRMLPYYILMRLPDTPELQYLLMTPFTPQNRDNMIAWMAAKCDSPGYGELIVYQLPKERLTYGPIQVEAMIDQNTLISQQLSLWDQKGSRVIRGNLVIIPIEKSFLYVEPVYLISEGTNIPQLKRVIINSGSKVVMESTLEEAIAAVFGAEGQAQQAAAPGAQEAAAPGAQAANVPMAPAGELSQAREYLDKANAAMRHGKWEEFGKAMAELEQILGESSSAP